MVLTRYWALKFPHPRHWTRFLRGMLANHQEQRFSATEDPRLCPVVWALPLGLLVVQARCQDLDPSYVDHDPRLRELAARAPFPVPAELKRSSWGLVGGRVVCRDYGD